MKSSIFLFPYNYIKKGSRIILYGAGDVGCDYYWQLREVDYCKIVKWVDSSKEITKRNKLVSEKELIKDLIYDFIVIAISGFEGAKEVMDYLISLGVQHSKICWSVSECVYKLDIIRENKFINKIFRWRVEDLLTHYETAENICKDIDKLTFDCLRVRYAGHCESREWFLNKEGTVAYLNNAKVACTSIKASIAKIEKVSNHIIADNILSQMGRRGDDIENDTCFKFTFVRNPFERLVSCYQNKYHTEKRIFGIDNRNLYFGFSHARYLVGYLYQDEGFERFVENICMIPEQWEDRHFRSQYSLLFEEGKCLVDYFGQIEELPHAYEEIQMKYDLNPLEHYNKSQKREWMSYYNEKTTEMIYQKYQKDFEIFGYLKEYDKLLEYLKNKGRK